MHIKYDIIKVPGDERRLSTGHTVTRVNNAAATVVFGFTERLLVITLCWWILIQGCFRLKATRKAWSSKNSTSQQ